MTESGVQCYSDDSVFILVNPLPDIQLTGPKDLCCDYGVILMNSDVIVPSGTPATGGWSVNSYPALMQNNQFFTDSACALIDPAIRYIDLHAVYTYTDPTTLCVNSDSIPIRVNSLPNLLLTPRTYCQDKNEVDLDLEVVLSPANTKLGTPSWRCIDSNSASNQFQANMLVNKSSPLTPEYWINIDEGNYTIQNPNQDTLVLEFSYTNPFGCKNKDTVYITISRVPKITFAQNRALCWDEGNISLNTLTGVNLTDGIWSCVDAVGYRPCSELGGITGDTINTNSSTQLANENVTPNQWTIRYDHTSSGCPAVNDTTLTINPLPNITVSPLAPSNSFCETAANVPLNPQVNPSGGTWSTADPTALVGGNSFSPSLATTKSAMITFYYNYTSPSTGCSNVDSILAQSDPSPTIDIPANTEFCRTQGRMVEDINRQVTATNTSGLIWGVVPNTNSSDRTVLGDVSTGDLTLNLQNNSADTFRIFAFAGGLASCSGTDGGFQIIVNPIPDASITNDNIEGCNPVTSNLGVNITNAIDPLTSTYNWTLNSGSAVIANPSTTFTDDGTQNISVVVTSDKGCDTTLTSTVEVKNGIDG